MRSILDFPIQDINHASADLKCLIETHYDLGSVIAIKSSEVGDTNRNFRIVCEKNGVQTWYFAKLFNVYKTLEKLDYERELYAHFAARAKGAMECPMPIPAKNGETVFRGVCSQAKISPYFVLFHYLNGRTIDEGLWRCKMKDGYLKGFAQGLAAFHDFSYGFQPSFVPTELTSLLTDAYAWEQSISKLELLQNDPRTEGYYEFIKDKKARILNALRRSRCVLERHSASLPVCMTHGDCSPNNYMYVGEDELVACGACDFDWSKVRPRIFDVAWMMCETLSIFDGETGLTVFEPERMVQFIRNYEQRIEKSVDFLPGKLSKVELSVLPDIMILVMISMTVCDRIGYMLENNQRLGHSEDNIGVTFWGLSIIDAIEQGRNAFCDALLSQ